MINPNLQKCHFSLELQLTLRLFQWQGNKTQGSIVVNQSNGTRTQNLQSQTLTLTTWAQSILDFNIVLYLNIQKQGKASHSFLLIYWGRRRHRCRRCRRHRCRRCRCCRRSQASTLTTAYALTSATIHVRWNIAFRMAANFAMPEIEAHPTWAPSQILL